MGVRAAWPLLYKPSCDLQPILALHLPEHIETLAACPRDETFAVNGRSKDGEHWSDGIKEFFCFRRGKGEFDYDVQYTFRVFYSDAAAIKWYESDTRGPWESKHYPVFKEVVKDGCSACVHYTEQDRADGEGGGGPMGIYHARASFRLRNTYIFTSTNERTSESEMLALAVRDLAQMLTVALSNTNTLSQ